MLESYLLTWTWCLVYLYYRWSTFHSLSLSTSGPFLYMMETTVYQVLWYIWSMVLLTTWTITSTSTTITDSTSHSGIAWEALIVTPQPCWEKGRMTTSASSWQRLLRHSDVGAAARVLQKGWDCCFSYTSSRNLNPKQERDFMPFSLERTE